MTSVGTRTRWLLPGVILLLAFLQLALLPSVAGGQSLLLYKLLALDSLSLTLGVAWTLALGLIFVAGIARNGPAAPALETIFVGAGLLLVAYSGSGVTLIVGLAVAGVGAWKALRRSRNRGEASFLRNLLIATALLVAAVAFSGVRAFVPPTGGVTEPWNPLVSIAAVVAAMLVARCWPFYYSRGQGSSAGGESRSPILALLCLAAPAVLAKMLVAAPVQPVGTWATVLLGMLALLGGAYAICAEGGGARHAAPALTGIAITGFGLAPASPAAAAGSIWVMLTGLLLVVAGAMGVGSTTMRGGRAFIPVAGLPGVWLISQGALDTGYGVVAALLLPAYALVMLLSPRRTEGTTGTTSGRASAAVLVVAIATAAIVAAYPQALAEWILRPVVGSMAGGVGALQAGASPWEVGLLMRSAQETILAALPATGVAVGVFLAWVALSWLKQVLALLTRRTPDGQSE